MEKNVPVLAENINIHDICLEVQSKNKCSQLTTQKDKKNIYQIKSQQHTHIEDQIKFNYSNYRSFLWNHQKYSKYPLPSSFDIINIHDRSEQSTVDGYQWFNFPILSYSCRQLSSLAVKIITNNGFANICDTELVGQVVKKICGSYNTVSYHNFSHGFSLMHMLYHLMELDINFKNLFTVEEVGYSLIAALAHDIGHFGTNNAFQVKMQTQLAKQANKEAILQKMHIKILFDCLKQNNIQIFERSKNPMKMKKLIVNNILSTDFSQHFKNLQKFKQLLKQYGNLSNNKELLNCSQPQLEDCRYLYLSQAFHACDIGNPCLEHQEYMNWAALLTYQFNTQTIIEQENNCQISQMLKYKSQKQFYLGQIGFINSFVYPLWETMSSQWVGFEFLVDNIRSNLNILQIKSKNQSKKELSKLNDKQI